VARQGRLVLCAIPQNGTYSKETIVKKEKKKRNNILITLNDLIDYSNVFGKKIKNKTSNVV
jgi:hypothetical protein